MVAKFTISKLVVKGFKRDFDTPMATIFGHSTRSVIRYRQQNKILEGIHWEPNPGGKVLYNSVLQR